ncbi:MAG: pyruvate formate lyase family protein, partial [Holophaga sp.]|nr:pyruvate formate lyase family protein [Holophaga sp.]
NGWDAFSPGHLDQHLWPFYRRGLSEGTLSRETAKELLECFFVKFNNHTAPPKVGVTAAESGTYTDFANLNLGGLLPDGSDGSNEVTHLLLEIIDEMHLLQPSSNVQISRKTPDVVLNHALRVIRNGYGFPSLFNADAVVEEQLRQGKTLEDARAGGCSGCVEVGAFGKEAYILTGYFNLMKMLELALHDGFDTRTNVQLGPHTGSPSAITTFDQLMAAFEVQTKHFLNIKIRGNQIIERIYATRMPAPFLSVLTDDCITKGQDYNAGGARYNNSFIQAVGIGSLADSLSALKELVFDKQEIRFTDFLQALDTNFAEREIMRQRLLNKTHKYGNDDDYADDLMLRAFRFLFESIDGRPNGKGGAYRLEMLPTTCHVYFGQVCLASADGRHKGDPLSEGISPVQGADRQGPTAVLKSAGKMDHVKTGGTLLNLKFTPSLLAGETGIDSLHHLVRAYFKLDGHHMQFNVVTADTL